MDYTLTNCNVFKMQRKLAVVHYNRGMIHYLLTCILLAAPITVLAATTITPSRHGNGYLVIHSGQVPVHIQRNRQDGYTVIQPGHTTVQVIPNHSDGNTVIASIQQTPPAKSIYGL